MKKRLKKFARHLDPRSGLFLSSTNWFLMAFISGAVNAGGYMACHRFVTHVTGFATLFGLDAANSLWIESVGMLSVPLFFLAGAMISAYFIDRPFLLGEKPKYYIVTSLIAVALGICGFGGALGWFGVFGEPLAMHRDYILLCLLVLASGMQNSSATSASSGTVRTTHLTGVTTDLGIGLIRTTTMKDQKSEAYQREKILLIARGGIIGSFVIGSIVGVWLFSRYEYYGFLMPAGLATFEAWVSFRYKELFAERHQWLRLEPF